MMELMRRPSIALLTALALAALPFLPWFSLPNSLSAKYFFLVILIDVVLLVYARYLLKGGKITVTFKRPFLFAIGLLVASLLFSVMGGVAPAHSFWGDIERLTGVYFLLHMIAWALVIGEVLQARDWGVVRKGIVLSAGLAALLSFLGPTGLGYQGSILWFDYAKSDSLFGNATYLGMYLLLGFLFGLIEYTKVQGRKWKLIIGSSLGAIVLSPILLSLVPLALGKIEIATVIAHPDQLLGVTRASGTVLVATILFLLVWWGVSLFPKERIRKGMKWLLAMGGVGACLVGSLLFITPGSIVQQVYLDDTTIGRFIVWESAKEAAMERPLLGWGEGNFERAFERHYDPQLFVELGRVSWFDRAHNVVLDTLVSGGIVGSLVAVIVIGAYVLVIYRARRRGDITEAEAVILGVLPFAHFAQLQTAFDVVPTYALLAVAGGYALSLERAHAKGQDMTARTRRYVAAGVAVIAVASIGVSLFYDLPRQLSLVRSLSERNPDARSILIKDSLSRPSDFEGLHYVTSEFVISVFKTLETTEDRESVLRHGRRFMEQYLAGYERHLSVEPGHYRAKINYAYLLLVRQAWEGEDASGDALKILEDAEALSPGNPLTDILVMMAHAYAGDREGADAALTAADARAPESALVRDAEAWLISQGSELPPQTFYLIGNI